MKKLFFSIIMVFGVILSACSTSSTGLPIRSADNDLPIETQLAVGTLKLEGTDQDVTVEQAQELIVLWQVDKELSERDTAAQAEVDGLITQIRDSMTSDQMQAITDMQITRQDVFSSEQEMAVVSNNSDGNTISSSENRPAGGPPSDGGSAPMDGGVPMNMSGAGSASGMDQSQSAQAGAGLQSATEIPSAFVEAVVQSLLKKIAA
jgi:hypothetical protein